MTTERYRSGATIPFFSEIQIDLAGAKLSALGDVLLRIRRVSNGEFFDFDDNTFKAAAHVDIDLLLSAVTSIDGVYEGEWDTSLITNETADDQYLIEIASVTSANFDAFGVVYLGDYVAPVYQAKLGIIDDDKAVTPADRYTFAMFRDSEPILTGLTAVTLQVINEAGADLVPSVAMGQIGATGIFLHQETTGSRRMVDGAHYIALLSFTVDGSARLWRQWIGRDSEA